MKKHKLQKVLVITLAYTLLVILWGAWVRISHSGDGCGDTWPLCHGQLIPAAEQKKTWVEYFHRLTSGFFGLLIIWIYIQVRKVTGKNEPLRKWAFWSLVFTISEALLGAKLVIFGLVGANASAYRALVMALHQANSLLLVASITLAWLHSLGEYKLLTTPFNSSRLQLKYIIKASIILFFVIAMTGAVAALANTLFPSSSLLDGIKDDFSSDSPLLVRLRTLHPLFGSLLGGAFAILAWITAQTTDLAHIKKTSLRLSAIFILAVAVGFTTLLALSPIWLKVTHLFLAHFVWINLIIWLHSLRFEKV